MKLKKHHLFLPSILISTSLFTASVFAYVDYRTNSVTAETQEMSNWCWAADSDMAAKYLGANSSQSAIVSYVYGSPVNDAGTVDDMQKGLSQYNISSTPVTTTVPFSTIVSNINNNENEIAVVSWNADPSQGHALLIRGYYEDTSNSTENVYYIDPSDASYHILSYSSFTQNSNFTWKNTLHTIYVN